MSYTYRQVGVNLNITPRVTYQDEIILRADGRQAAASGQNVNVAGTLLPSVRRRGARTTELRLRDGESNLLAGLIREEDDANTLQSFPGITQIPLLRSLFGNTQSTDARQTDIVMIVTPHIVRSHELTADDLKPMYVGTGQNFGAGSAPHADFARRAAASAAGRRDAAARGRRAGTGRGAVPDSRP